MNRRDFLKTSIGVALAPALAGISTQAHARSSLLAWETAINAFKTTGGIPSSFYTTSNGVSKYKAFSSSGQAIQWTLMNYGIPAGDSMRYIFYRNYNGLASIQEDAIGFPHCVGFVKGMTGNMSPSSTWYPGDKILSNMPASMANLFTGTVMAYFGSDSPSASIPYGSYSASNVHVLIIVKANVDSKGNVVSALVVDQNYKTTGAISRWTIPYNGAGKGFLKNYRIVMI